MLFNKPKSERDPVAAAPNPTPAVGVAGAGTASAVAVPVPSSSVAVPPVSEDPSRRRLPAEAPRPSVLGPGGLVRGYIGSPGPLHFQGEIEGTVEAPQVTLGAEGAIRGKVTCDRASLDGRFDGRLDCRELNVGASARVDGRVRCDNLVLALGAQINAEVKVGRGD